jgi:NAD-dependent SIR2 family protein deacetylase
MSTAWLPREEHLVKEEYYQKFIDEMHWKAGIYEKEAMKLFLDKAVHHAHCAMSNARCLRTAANLMDNTACNGG